MSELSSATKNTHLLNTVIRFGQVDLRICTFLISPEVCSSNICTNLLLKNMSKRRVIFGVVTVALTASCRSLDGEQCFADAVF